jgi:hypothetical protein
VPSSAVLPAFLLQMCTIVAYTSNLDQGLYQIGQRMDQLVSGQLTGGWAGEQAGLQQQLCGMLQHAGWPATCTAKHSSAAVHGFLWVFGRYCRMAPHGSPALSHRPFS